MDARDAMRRDDVDRFLHARVIIATSRSHVDAFARWGLEAPDIDQFGLRALPLAFCAIANLRMALEYSAQEIQRTACPDGDPVKSSFPIAANLPDFNSDLGRSFPGLSASRQDIRDRLLSYQSFSPEGFEWLPTLQGLWNHSKHVDLAPEGIVAGGIIGTISYPGGPVEQRNSFFLLMEGNRPLAPFLKACADGIERIVREIEGDLAANS